MNVKKMNGSKSANPSRSGCRPGSVSEKRLIGLALLLVLSAAVADAGPFVSDTAHEDGRGIPKLVFPGPGGAPAANGRQAADAFVKANGRAFKVSTAAVDLELVATRESLLGTHYRYQQMLNGVPVDGADLVVSVSRRSGQVCQAYNNTFPVTKKPALQKASVGKEAALDAAWKHLRVHGRLLGPEQAKLVYVPVRDGFRFVYKTLVAVEAPFGHWEHQIDAASGEVVSVRDTIIYRKGAPKALPDFSAYGGDVWPRSKTAAAFEAVALKQAAAAAAAVKATANGTALVFDGDPRTYLANAALVNSSSAASFSSAYVTRTLRDINLTSGTYSLSGPWVAITEIEAPTAAPSTSITGAWTAQRGNNAFNDVMTYYHIDQNQRYLQSLGYVGAAGIQYGPIEADSNGVDGDDNSYYSPSLNCLSFGHGGVDDNEDADVILHEYGHAITSGIIPAWGGGDTGAIGEGFGDYWGASYSSTTQNGTTFHPEWAFSWDGHGAGTWSGRFLNMTNLTYDASHTYVDHEMINSIANYSDQLWGTPIFQAFLTLRGMGCPREDIDKIIIESFFGVGSGPSMRDMANATVAAAQELYPSGPHAAVFHDKFARQQILTVQKPALIYPAGGESFGTGSVVLVQWDRNNAPPGAYAKIEYTGKLSGALDYFSDQVEGGVNGWTATKTTAGSAWTIVTTSSHSPTHSWYAKNDTVSSSQYLTKSSLVVSNGAVLAFWHSYDLESGYDGAVVEISENGTTWIDIGTNAVQNGYNWAISAYDGSAIAGRPAFSGSSGGYVETVIPLTAYQGKTVSIRFRETDDSMYAASASSGWWIDDIRLSVGAPWSAVATTPTNTSSYAWTLPAAVGTNFGVRVKLAGSNLSDSAWSTSGAFKLKAVPNVAAWPTASAITYGQALSASSLSGGVCSAPGAYAFAAPATVPTAGVARAAVSFTPSDTTTYISVTGSVNVTVNKAGSQVTVWPTASAIVVGQSLASSALSGGSASPAGAFAFATPSLVPPAGQALQSVTFTPGDSANYTAVSGQVSVTVAPVPLISGTGVSLGTSGSTFRFDAVGGIQYRIRYADSLLLPWASWSWVAPPADGWVTALTNGPLVIADTGATNSPTRFYRLEERTP